METGGEGGGAMVAAAPVSDAAPSGLSAASDASIQEDERVPEDVEVMEQDSKRQKQQQQMSISFRSALSTKKPVVRTCGCDRREVCHVCRRCIEAHCVCGPKAFRRMERLVCRESRSCDCVLVDESASRCQFCRGCRRGSGGMHSHCFCEEHYSLYRQLRAVKAADDTEQFDHLLRNGSCSCFLLFKPAEFRDNAEILARKQRRQERDDRLARIRRASGIPSTENLYMRKIVVSSDSEGDSDNDESDIDEFGAELVTIALPSLKRELEGKSGDKHDSSRVIVGKNGCTLRESVEPPRMEARKSTFKILNANAENAAERAFSNFFYLADQEHAWPTDDIIDYIAYIASIQVANVPELIGTMDDTAAVAVGIIVEEYVKQLVEEFMRKPDDEDRESDEPSGSQDDEDGDAYTICPLAEQSVKAFTNYVLCGFDWKLFRNQWRDDDPTSLQDHLTQQIFVSLSACRSRNASPMTGFDISQVKGWIRAAMIDHPGSKLQFPADHLPDNSINYVPDELEEKLYNTDMPYTKEFSTRIAVRPSVGAPLYSMSADGWAVRGTHEVSVRVNNLPSKAAANESMQKITDVMDKFRDKVSKEQRDWIYTRNYPIYVVTRKHINEYMRKKNARLEAERIAAEEAARKPAEEAARKAAEEAARKATDEAAKNPLPLQHLTELLAKKKRKRGKKPTKKPAKAPAKRPTKDNKPQAADAPVEMSAYLRLQKRYQNSRIRALAKKAAARAQEFAAQSKAKEYANDPAKASEAITTDTGSDKIVPAQSDSDKANEQSHKPAKSILSSPKQDVDKPKKPSSEAGLTKKKQIRDRPRTMAPEQDSAPKEDNIASEDTSSSGPGTHQGHPHSVSKQKRAARTIDSSDTEEENPSAQAAKEQKVDSGFQLPSRKLVGMATSVSTKPDANAPTPLQRSATPIAARKQLKAKKRKRIKTS